MALRIPTTAASLMLVAATMLGGCTTTNSYLRVSSSYPSVMRAVGNIRPAVPTCQPGQRLIMRSRASTEAWVDTEGRHIRPNDILSVYTTEHDYRCVTLRDGRRR